MRPPGVSAKRVSGISVTATQVCPTRDRRRRANPLLDPRVGEVNQPHRLADPRAPCQARSSDTSCARSTAPASVVTRGMTGRSISPGWCGDGGEQALQGAKLPMEPLARRNLGRELVCDALRLRGPYRRGRAVPAVRARRFGFQPPCRTLPDAVPTDTASPAPRSTSAAKSGVQRGVADYGPGSKRRATDDRGRSRSWWSSWSAWPPVTARSGIPPCSG